MINSQHTIACKTFTIQELIVSRHVIQIRDQQTTLVTLPVTMNNLHTERIQ